MKIKLAQKILGIISKINIGQMKLTLPDNKTYLLGPGGEPEAELIIKNWRAVRRLITQGDFGFVESYLDEDWISPNPAKVVEIAVINRPSAGTHKVKGAWHKLARRVMHLSNINTRRGARKNISAHYDLGNDFYKEWLDQSMTYSSAFFSDENQTLFEAQKSKYNKIANLLELKPEHKLLEIGFGWGGFAEYAAKEYGCKVTGLTLSKEQLNFAREKIYNLGLSEKIELRLQDFRDVEGHFDRIASIEMFEAIGESNWPRYFKMIKNKLPKDGSAALQIITIEDASFERYRYSADFIQSYIFPGGMVPSIAVLKQEIKKANLKIDTIETFGKSYARTLNEWRNSFINAWSRIEKLGFDDRFKRTWEMYLAYCEGGFKAKSIDVGQFKISSY